MSGAAYLTPADAARVLSVSLPTVRRMMRQWRVSRGREGLRYSSLSGRLVRISREDIDRLMRERSRPLSF